MKLNQLLKKIKNYFKTEAFESDEDFIHFICEGNVLPSPLTADREEELIDAATLNQSEQAKNELIEHNLRLVVYVSKKFISTGHPLDDLISIGSIGLIKAINSFKKDKNIKLATYASRCIENEILMYLRKTVKQKREVSLDEPIRKDKDGGELMLSDVLYGHTDNEIFQSIETDIEKNILIGAIKNLNEREREIMTLRYGLNSGIEKTQKEVADYLNISQSYISRLEKKIIVRLKKELEIKFKN